MKYRMHTVSSAILIAGLVASAVPLSLFAQESGNPPPPPRPTFRETNGTSTPPRPRIMGERGNGTSTPPRPEMIDQKRNGTSTPPRSGKDDRRIQAEKQISNHVDWMSKRFDAAISRLGKLTSRLESRIAKIKAGGKDTSAADALVADAKTNIAQAKLDEAKIPGLVSTSLQASTTLVGQFGDLKTLSDTIRKELQTAQNDLDKAVKSLLGLHLGGLEGDKPKIPPPATTTTATTTP